MILNATRTTPYFDFALAALLFLPTLFFVPAVAYAVSVLFFLALPIRSQVQKWDWILVVFLVLVIVNLVTGVKQYNSSADSIPISVLFFIPCVFVGRFLPPRAIRYLVTFTLLECLVVFAEVIARKPFFFAGQAKGAMETVEGTDILYMFRPYGLSSNSSVIAAKILVAIILVFALKEMFRFLKTILGVLFLSLLLTFNRTAMVASLALCGMLYLQMLWTLRGSPRKLLPHLIFLSAAAAGLAYIFQDLIFQLTLGGKDIKGTLTGRTVIWSQVVDFIKLHPFLGNHSYSFKTHYMDRMLHSHNSYLQAYATHGCIALLLFGYIALSLTRKNFIFAGAILIYSLTQYGIFWNFSYMDAVFYFLLGFEGRAVAKEHLPKIRSWGRGAREAALPGALEPHRQVQQKASAPGWKLGLT